MGYTDSHTNTESLSHDSEGVTRVRGKRDHRFPADGRDSDEDDGDHAARMAGREIVGNRSRGFWSWIRMVAAALHGDD